MTKRKEMVAKIIDYILASEDVCSTEIAKEFEISLVTARRTLNLLVEMSHEFSVLKFKKEIKGKDIFYSGYLDV